MKTYENSKNKRYVQQLIFNQCGGMGCNALVLAGPNCKEYLRKVVDHVACNPSNKVISYEKDFSVYQKQVKYKFGTGLSAISTKKFKFINDEIINAKPERFCDIDLMCHLKTAKSTIVKLFNEQSEFNIENYKVFTFTYSRMRETSTIKSDLIPFLENLLGCTAVIGSCGESSTHKEYWLYSSQYVKITVYEYTDSSPMTTVCIQYY